jgi:hypothetical protein
MTVEIITAELTDIEDMLLRIALKVPAGTLLEANPA